MQTALRSEPGFTSPPCLPALGFDELPQLAAQIDESLPGIQRDWTVGLGHRWLMPCAAYRAPAGFDAFVRERDHHTLAFHLQPHTAVERVDGAAGQRIDRHRFTVQHRGESDHYRCPESVAFRHLYFRQGLLEHVAESAGQRASPKPLLDENLVACSDPVLLADLHAYVSRAAARDETPSAIEMDARALVICLGLLERHSRGGFVREAPRGGLAPWQLRRVCDAMQAGLDHDFTLASLASLAGLSPTHFCRAFRQSTGCPPFEWLRLQRIARAKSLLEAAQVSLAQVALAVGFAGQGQFTTAFRRVTGITPGAWRRQRLA